MSFLQRDVYPRLPVFVQNWAISAYGYSWHKRRFGGIFGQEVRGYRQREEYTVEQWRDYQTVVLRKLLVNAYEYVPLYRERFAAHGFHANRLEKFELEDLSRLPYLTKDDLRQFGTTSLLSRKREAGGAFFSSSGSTGTPTQILFSNQMHQKWSAGFETRIRHWAGVNYKIPRGMIGGRRVVPEGVASPPYYRYNCIEKQTYFSAYHISPFNIENYISGIKKYDVKYMTGYAMSNYFLAKLIESKGLKVPELNAVITSSEKLTTEMRRCFERVYGCKTYDSYSGIEACGLISENEFGQLLISPDIGIMEFRNASSELCEPGEEGEVVSTGFLNYDQPLIRYKIGDSAIVATNQRTLCGRNFTVVEEIKGRTEDTIMGPDGRLMVRFHGIFINLPNVIRGQIVQTELDRFEIKVETQRPLSIDERNAIRQRMVSQLGKIELDISEVEQIPIGPNGKFKAVVSNIKSS